MLSAKIQPQSFLGSEEDFKGFFSIYRHGCHLNYQTVTICTNFQSPVHIKIEANWHRDFKKKKKKKKIKHLHSPWERADNPQGRKFFVVTKMFYYFNQTSACKFQPLVFNTF